MVAALCSGGVAPVWCDGVARGPPCAHTQGEAPYIRPYVGRLPEGCAIHAVCAGVHVRFQWLHERSQAEVATGVLNEPVLGTEVVNDGEGGAHVAVSTHKVTHSHRLCNRVLGAGWRCPDGVEVPRGVGSVGEVLHTTEVCWGELGVIVH